MNEGKKPKTNADVIRSMTDEQLVDIISNKCKACIYRYADCEIRFVICEEGISAWMQQEAEHD